MNNQIRALDAMKAAILFCTLFTLQSEASNGQCSRASSMFSYHLVENRAISDKKTTDLRACFDLCRQTLECKSVNYKLEGRLCQLNSNNHLTHPKHLKEKHGYIYVPVLDIVKQPSKYKNHTSQQQPQPKYRTCAKIKEMNPSSPSGVYELEVNGISKSVYCDMDNYGGGWALVVSISNSNNEHTLRTANNCFNSSLCVPFVTGTLPGRKLADSDIHSLASHEGTFRFDTKTTSATLYTVFYRVVQGAQYFDAGCRDPNCPRIIVTYSYPYQWESNCKGIETGYLIGSSSNCYTMFDGHDNLECGSMWFSSGYQTKRLLYYYCDLGSKGFFNGIQGYMFVR